MLIHGSCAAREGHAVLIQGPPGAGKSDLLLRLLGLGWTLVADDQVEVAPDGLPKGLLASAPASLAGMLEVRGLGILRDLPHFAAPLALAVQLAPRPEVPRLPVPARLKIATTTLPLLILHAFDASTPQKLEWALAAATGRARMHAGAFAA